MTDLDSLMAFWHNFIYFKGLSKSDPLYAEIEKTITALEELKKLKGE